MTSKPNDDAIAVEIANLQVMKPRVRRLSGFGYDNHRAIDAQITVLRERMPEPAIYDGFEPDDSEDDNQQHILDCALEARRWLDGEMGSEVPSEGWKTALA